MEITDRMSDMRDGMRQRKLESKIGDVRHENERLRLEGKMLRDELRVEREEFERLIGSLAKGRSGRPGRFRRMVTLVGAAGGAYVLGAKAGRERYEQIRAWWSRRNPSSTSTTPAILERP